MNAPSTTILTDAQLFDPHAYLKEYYHEVGPENLFLLRFFHDTYARLPDGFTLLEFGGGPTIYQLISAGRRAREIVFAEHGERNRVEVQRWLAGHDDAFDWRPYFDEVHRLEGVASSGEAVRSHEVRLRRVVSSVLPCDAREADPLLGARPGQFDALSVIFVLEAVIRDDAEAARVFRNVLSLVKPGGHALLVSITGATSYRVGDAASSPCTPCGPVADVPPKGNDRALTARSPYGTTFENTFAGARSFMRRSYAPDVDALSTIDIAVLGVPFDLGTTNRPGARFGPEGIRRASSLISFGCPLHLEVDPFDQLAVVDCGDCDLPLNDLTGALEAIRDISARVLASQARR